MSVAATVDREVKSPDASDPPIAVTPRPSRWERLWHGYPGWVLLNVAVLCVVLLLDLLTVAFRGPPGIPTACAIMAGGVVILGGLWFWMIGPARGVPDAVCKRYAQFAGAVSLILAVAVSRLSPVGNVPGAILALPPLIAVAFHHRLVYAVLLAMFIALLTLLPARLFIEETPAVRLAASFNAAGLAMAGVVVALVVSLLTTALRRETHRLRNSLAELRATRAKLVAEEKLAAVGRLAAGIAHEIRNPVAMISSSLEMAASDATPADTRAEMSDIARQEAARLTTLTNDFLAYARGKPPAKQSTSLDTITGYVADLIKARASESKVTIKDEAPPDLRANVDPFQLHHALLNLAANAIDATPASGTVTIGAALSDPPDQHCADLFVENTGDPVPPEVVARLFEPFVTTKPQGTGLGLPIARRIAEAHRGDLLLTHNDPGRVRFTLRLPRGEPTTTDP